MADTWRAEDSQQLMLAIRDHKERCRPCRKALQDRAEAPRGADWWWCAMSDLTVWTVVSATTIQRGDQVDMRGWRRTVVDMYALRGNRKRLVFDDGGEYCLERGETLYAYRDTG